MAYYGPSQAYQQRDTVSTFQVRLDAEKIGPHKVRVKKKQHLLVGLCMKIFTISQWAHTNPYTLLLKYGPCCSF